MLLMGCLTVAAQEPAATTVYDFQPHWYGQVQVGGQYTLGELSFGDLLSPNAQIAVGYQFSPAFGLRLNANAWQSKAGIKGNVWNGSAVEARCADWKWNYVAPAIDFTVNLSNLIAGFNPTRLFNLGVFAGVGANIGFSNKDALAAKQAFYAGSIDDYNKAHMDQNIDYAWEGTKVRFMGQAGVTGDFRLSDRVSLGLEVSANGVNDHYNSKRSNNIDWYFNALAGVKIALGETYTTRTIEAPKPQIIEKIVEKIVEKPVEVIKYMNEAPSTQTNASAEIIRREIFFENAVTTIKKADEQKVKEIADFLKRNPNAKVTVEGYASKDAGRTSSALNYRLAGQRAARVVDMLKKKFGIPASRIVSVNKGDTEQPFPTNEKNRVSICVAQ